MKYEFKSPYTFDGETFTDLEVPLEGMTGAQFLEVKKSYVKSDPGANPVTMVFDQSFVVYLCAKLCKQKLEFFEGLPVADFVGLCTKVSGFLLS